MNYKVVMKTGEQEIIENVHEVDSGSKSIKMTDCADEILFMSDLENVLYVIKEESK